MKFDYYLPGEWNFICQECGAKFKSTSLKKRWDGAIVCPADWEPRHPDDYPVPPRLITMPTVTSPPVADEFLPMCTLEGRLGIVGYGVVGCSINGVAENGWQPIPN